MRELRQARETLSERVEGEPPDPGAARVPATSRIHAVAPNADSGRPPAGLRALPAGNEAKTACGAPARARRPGAVERELERNDEVHRAARAKTGEHRRALVEEWNAARGGEQAMGWAKATAAGRCERLVPAEAECTRRRVEATGDGRETTPPQRIELHVAAVRPRRFRPN